MEFIEVKMVLDNFLDMPSFRLPPDFQSVMYEEGGERKWAQIEMTAGEFPAIEKALEHFKTEFGKHKKEMSERCFFIRNEKGDYIGTATAWYDDSFLGESRGRLHWVAIDPAFQGLHLGKPLVSLAMEKLRKLHTKAYLTTQTTSYKAINMYLDFGFMPFLDAVDSERAWKLLAGLLKHPKLERFLDGSRNL